MNRGAHGNQEVTRDASKDEAEAVEKLGAAIIDLLRQADELAKQDSEIAFAKAHKLAVELRASEHLADSLQAQVNALEQRARKAEGWLLQVHEEIEDKFSLVNKMPRSQRR